MSDIKGILEKIVLTGIGAMALTADKAKELVNEMIAKGELTVEQGKAINEELKQNVKSHFADRGFEKNLDGLDKLDADQLSTLRERILDIEAKRAAAPDLGSEKDSPLENVVDVVVEECKGDCTQEDCCKKDTK
jgi:polyhydroxyalkanoate synthesis regulator phasin